MKIVNSIVCIILMLHVTVVNAQSFFPLEAANISNDATNTEDLSTTAEIEVSLSVNGQDIEPDLLPLSQVDYNGRTLLLAMMQQADAIDMRLKITPEANHIGQQANILVTVDYFDLSEALQGNFTSSQSFVLSSDGGSELFVLPESSDNYDIKSLSGVNLEPENYFSIYQGQLVDSSLMVLNFYYSVDGVVISTNNALSLVVSDEALLTPSTRQGHYASYDMWITTITFLVISIAAYIVVWGSARESIMLSTHIANSRM